MNTELPSPSPEPTPPLFSHAAHGRRGSVLGPLLAAVLLLAGGGLYLFLRAPGAPAASTAQPEAVPSAAPAQAAVSLAGTDPEVRELLRGLSGDAELQRWLGAEDLVRRLVSSVHAVAEGQVPRTQLALLAPGGSFRAAGRGGVQTIAPQSYARYDRVARTFASIDAGAAKHVYGALAPLLRAAHAELAPPGRTFEQTLSQAVGRLSAVPVPTAPVRVLPKGALYVHADPQLEALSGAQKQLLRMGPDNMRKVQAKLTELSAALGLLATSQAARP